MVEKPIVFLLLVWTFVPNALPQPLQNLTVKLSIEGLTRRYEFLADNPLDIEKNDQHIFDIIFGHGEFEDFWHYCCLVSGS
jgi:hypothetical protein